MLDPAYAFTLSQVLQDEDSEYFITGDIMIILLRMSKKLMNRGLPYLDMSIQIYEPSKGLCWLFLRPTAQATEPPGAVADL